MNEELVVSKLKITIQGARLIDDDLALNERKLALFVFLSITVATKAHATFLVLFFKECYINQTYSFCR